MTSPSDNDLEQMFAQMRKGAPEPSADLMARVLGDAERVQPAPPLSKPVAAAGSDVGSLWRQLLEHLGGWPAMAGLASVAMVGVWIGVAPPTDLGTNLAALLDASDLSEVMGPSSGFDFTQFEG